MTHPQVQVNSILSLSTLSTRAMNEQEQDLLALSIANRINDGEGRQKGVKGSHQRGQS